jgi:hypothetical protein
MPNEFEYFMSDKPVVYPDHYVMNKVREMKLNYVMQFHINEYSMMHDARNYEEHLQRRLSTELGEAVRTSGKLDFKTWDSPQMGRTLRAETIVMTKQDLYKLLGEFGIHITIHEKKL